MPTTPDIPAAAEAVAAAAGASIPEAIGLNGLLATSQADGEVRDRTSAGVGTERRATLPHFTQPTAETNPSHTAQELALPEQEDIKPDLRELEAQHPYTSVAAQEPEQQGRTPKRSRLDEELRPEEKKPKTTRLSCETEESDMEGIEEETGVAVSREHSAEQSETGGSVGDRVFAPFGVPIGFHLCLDDAHATAMELLITVSGFHSLRAHLPSRDLESHHTALSSFKLKTSSAEPRSDSVEVTSRRATKQPSSSSPCPRTG